MKKGEMVEEEEEKEERCKIKIIKDNILGSYKVAKDNFGEGGMRDQGNEGA